jgi:hypothetical protein
MFGRQSYANITSKTSLIERISVNH